MDEILIITNHADETHVTEFAYQFAWQNGKDLIVAQTSKPQPSMQLSESLVDSRNNWLNKQDTNKFSAYSEPSRQFNTEPYQPRVRTVDASRFTERELAAYICRENCSMIISRLKHCRLNLQTVLNQLNCPLMLLPENYVTPQIKRISYLTDLRYCQLPVVNHLSKFKGVSILLAHICLQGLPDLVPAYGNELFKNTVGRYISYPELFFSQIKETNIEKIIDTLISTMRADMLACLNHSFHFQQLLGNYLPKCLPEYISVPLLIFPC